MIFQRNKQVMSLYRYPQLIKGFNWIVERNSFFTGTFLKKYLKKTPLKLWNQSSWKSSVGFRSCSVFLRKSPSISPPSQHDKHDFFTVHQSIKAPPAPAATWGWGGGDRQQVASGLCFKAKLSTKPLTWKFFFSQANNTHFLKKGFVQLLFALSLVLKVKLFRTRDWPID